MAKLYLMRHSTTYYNESDKFAGVLDIPLSPKGIDDAIKFGELHKGIAIDYVYVSSLSRSLDTALLFLSSAYNKKVPIICKRRKVSLKIENEFLPIVKCSELNERHYGKLQNLSKKRVDEIYGKEQVFLWRRDFNMGPPSGEAFVSIVERVESFFKINLIEKLCRDKNILVVAHQNTLRALWYLIFGTSEALIKDIEFDNNQLTEVTFENGVFTI